jgi:threonine/homoserine/homoserine lactone efflux protein
VIAFAVMIAFGVRSIEAVFRGVTRVELWVRRITGAVFIVAGIYYAAVYTFEVL